MASIGIRNRFSGMLVRLATACRAAWVTVPAALVVAAAGPALAANATGTWSGKATCWQEESARVVRTEQRGNTMLISQKGEELFVQIDGTAYRGDSQDTNRRGTRARGSAGREAPSEVLTLRFNIDGLRGTARVTAQSAGQNGRGGRHCRYRFSRVSCQDPGIESTPPPEVCGDGIVNDAPNEECDGAATGTPCDGACTADCTCPTSCQPLDVTGHWEGTWVSEATGESGPVVADLSQDTIFVVGTIEFPPFVDPVFSAPFIEMDTCAPAEFSTGALLASGILGRLDGVATSTSMLGTWALSDGSDHGTWELSR